MTRVPSSTSRTVELPFHGESSDAIVAAWRAYFESTGRVTKAHPDDHDIVECKCGEPHCRLDSEVGECVDGGWCCPDAECGPCLSEAARESYYEQRDAL